MRRQLLPSTLLRACVLMLSVATACTLPPITTPTPRPTPTVAPTPNPTATPTPTAPTPSPTPDLGAVPAFDAGATVATMTDGLRIRRLPGVDRSILVQRLPAGTRLEVVLGPLPVDGLGWYLVRDIDDADPSFGEGWIAAGFDPEPFIAATGDGSTGSYVSSFAHAGDAEFGPLAVPDDQVAIRWAAIDPDGVGCVFALDLRTGSGDPVPAIRAAVGNGPTPGVLGSDYFTDQPALRGQLFATVRSDCAWAITVVRVLPSPSGSP